MTPALPRRRAFAGALAGAALPHSAAQAMTPVAFAMPPGACDCHAHVFPDAGRFPFWEGRLYTPPVATLDDLRTHQAGLGLERVVVVQPSVYGTDNAAMLDALGQLGPARARGIAVIGPAAGAAELGAMHEAGVRGIRLNLDTAGVSDPAAAKRILDAAVQQVAGRPWHVEMYVGARVVAEPGAELAGLPVPLVLDHFAGANGTRGLDQPGFGVVLDLLRSGKAYATLSAPYRASPEAPDYPSLLPLARALVAANADRILWASDWPHPGGPASPDITATDIHPPYQTDDGRTLGLLARWVPDEATRRKILVDNPARLYGF